MFVRLVPSEGSEGAPAPGRPPASGGSMAVFGVPWLVGTSHRSLSLQSQSVLRVCGAGSELPLVNRTLVTLCQCLQDDLILI